MNNLPAKKIARDFIDKTEIKVLPSLRPIFPASLLITQGKKGLQLTLQDGYGGKKIINISSIATILEDFLA